MSILTPKISAPLFIWISVGLATGATGLFYMDLARAEWVIGHLGYPFAWIVAVFSLLALWKNREGLTRLLTAHRLPLLLLAGLAGAIALSEPRFMKVTWDEQVHAAVAYGAHAEGRIIQPIAMTLDPEGPGGPVFDYVSTSFRGYGFSWVVSLFHDVFGPHVRWIYTVNFIAGVAALGAAYTWCFLLCRSRGAALAAALLLAGASIFGVVMNSGAYDMLNLTLVLSLGAAVTGWCSKRGENELLTVVCLASALAVARVESVAYYVAALLPAFVYLQKSDTKIGAVRALLAFTPILLLPNFALQKVLNGTPHNLHQGQLRDGVELLSSGHLVANIKDTVKFMLNLSPIGAGSAVLVIVALTGTTLLVRGRIRAGASGLLDGRTLSIGFGVIAAGLYAMVMCSFWGGPGANPQMTRFTLPLFGIMAVLGAAGLSESALTSKTKAHLTAMGLLVAASCQLLFVTASFHHRGESLKIYPFACAVDEVSSRVDEIASAKTLFISRATAALISRGKLCVNEGVFTRENGALLTRMNNGEFTRFIHMRKATDAPLCEGTILPPELRSGWIEIFRTHSSEGNMLVLDEWAPKTAHKIGR